MTWQSEAEKTVADTYNDVIIIKNKNGDLMKQNYNISKLVIDANGGVWNSLNENSIFWLSKSETLEVKDPVKLDSTFEGWNMSGSDGIINGNTFIMGSSNVTLTAKWKSYYELTVDANGGEWDGEAKQTILYGNTVTIEDPTKLNYVFAGWNIDEGSSSINDKVFKMGNKDTTITANWIDEIKEFTYTGDVQEFISAYSGLYKLEVWGAQGGNIRNVSGASDYNATNGNITRVGGYGSYSTGIYNIEKGLKIYVYIGGCGGSSNLSTSVIPGGYNGGGSGGAGKGAYNCYSGGGGGGATHMSLDSGLLSTLSSKKDTILIVAGGGGGALNHNFTAQNGGAGGGINGNVGIHIYPSAIDVAGGNQINGYSFGKGSNGKNYTDRDYDQSGSAGGGGGLYGGYANTSNQGGVAGAGGSGYIGNSLLTDKYMYCYNCTTSDEESTKTYTTTNVSETPTKDYAKIGDGYARITFISE